MNWTLQTIPVEKLIEWKRNPRKITPEDFEELKKSFAEFSQARTLTVSPMKNGKFEIIGGNQSKKALKELGITEIQCSVAEKELSEQEKEKLSIQLNHRNKGEGIWDFQILDEFTVDLEGLGVDVGINPDNYGTDFTLPDGDKAPFQQMTFTLADDQAIEIQNAISDIKKTDLYKYMETYGNENSNGNALYLIIQQWGEQRT